MAKFSPVLFLNFWDGWSYIVLFHVLQCFGCLHIHPLVCWWSGACVPFVVVALVHTKVVLMSQDKGKLNTLMFKNVQETR